MREKAYPRKVHIECLRTLLTIATFFEPLLEKLVQNNPEWKKEEHMAAFTAIKKVYTAQSAFFDDLKESQLEERFFTIIFKKILPFFEVQESSGPDSPDYAFFATQESIDNAHRSADSKSFSWKLIGMLLTIGNRAYIHLIK
jgi:hypothetical protein